MIKIQELSAEGCHNCAEVKKYFEEVVKPQFPEVEIEYIDMLSDVGQSMVVKYQIMSSPGIIINDELFSMGGLDKEKLIDKINSLH